MKSPKELERILKGCGNHRRVEILLLLRKKSRLTLGEIADELKINFRIASEHIRRMSAGGLIVKRYRGRYVEHMLTPRARNTLTFLGKLE
jgi:DNA-binding transcriptional ArsR family regulator